MQIAIVGYGKMGKRIEQIATDRGHIVTRKIDSSNKEDIHKIVKGEVAIEFTNPDSARKNYQILSSSGIATVTGTTGWHDSETEIFNWFERARTPFFYASNFSIGVYIFRSINKVLARAMNNFPEYQAQIDEWHHLEKKDSPSGTAITLGKDILEESKNYSRLAPDKEALENELPIWGHRQKDVTGKHIVNYKSKIDQISIQHEAFSRDGFALGAVLAAEFINEKQSGIFSMNNLIKLDE